MTVQATYPITVGTTFDYDYYVGRHLPQVEEHFTPHGMTALTASKGLAGGPARRWPFSPSPQLLIGTLLR